jgi:hypothetical protein
VMNRAAAGNAKELRRGVSPAVAAALPLSGFDDHADSEVPAAPPRRPRDGDRLAWPAAATVILATSLALWAATAALVRVMLG